MRYAKIGGRRLRAGDRGKTRRGSRAVAISIASEAQSSRSRIKRMEMAIAILVNGENRSAKPGATVADILRELGLDSGRVAIERNLEILPRPPWSETRVEPRDPYEKVHFVGGA